MKQLKVNKEVFKFDSKHNTKRDTIKAAKKLKLEGFNVRIKGYNPFLLYKKKRQGTKHLMEVK